MLIGGTSIPAAAASWRPNFLSRLFISTDLPQIDMGKWKYQKEDQVYYQAGIQYVEKSPDSDYDTLAIFVPAAYLNGTANGDGTYTCTIRKNGKTGTYTSETAPMVFPINTPGYAAQKELNGYTDVTDYTNAGFIYVHVGAQGRDAGAPAGVTDFKAGIRYIRYNQGVIPGNTDAIFTFGMLGGGAHSAVLGASGDNASMTHIWIRSARSRASAMPFRDPCAGAPLQTWIRRMKPMNGTWVPPVGQSMLEAI